MSSLTTKQKSEIDRLWTEFWTGGITNPLTVIEQISFLIFVRLLDVMESNQERKAERLKQPYQGLFQGANDPKRWKNFRNLPALASEEDAKAGNKGTLQVVRDEVFPHLRGLKKGSSFATYMQDAQLLIQKPSLLASAVAMIDKLPLTEGDTKGDLYEYLLSKPTTAGINGQFRTPRHIIRFMVDLLEPKPTEIIGDPACGTAGFLIGVMQYLLETYTSPEGRHQGEDGETIYTGDLLEPYREHIQSKMLQGFDFDATMLRIASMNLLLHGIENPAIYAQDTLSSSFPERFPALASDAFDVILANPPFKSSLDAGDVHFSLTQAVKTKKTELLFLTLILRMLKTGGRSATIVPDGVLFGASKAHKTLRELLVKRNQLEAVFSLPSGAFKPYSGVSTAILVFSKGGKTDHVFFYDIEADGFSLDDKRDPIDHNDLPDALASWQKRDPKQDTARTAKGFLVPLAEIEQNDFDLSINRYKQTSHEETVYESPQILLARLQEIEAEITKNLEIIEGML